MQKQRSNTFICSGRLTGNNNKGSVHIRGTVHNNGRSFMFKIRVSAQVKPQNYLQFVSKNKYCRSDESRTTRRFVTALGCLRFGHLRVLHKLPSRRKTKCSLSLIRSRCANTSIGRSGFTFRLTHIHTYILPCKEKVRVNSATTKITHFRYLNGIYYNSLPVRREFP